MSQVDVMVKLKNVNPRMRNIILVKWLKHEGQTVRKGEPLYVMENLKGVFEVESEFDGKVQKLLVARGTKVAPTQDLAVIRTGMDGDQPSQPATLP